MRKLVRLINCMLSVCLLQSCSCQSEHQDWRDLSERGARAQIDGSLSTAHQLFKDALKLCEDQHLNDVYLLVSLNNCAIECMNESKFQEALAYFERVHKLNGRNEADELLALSQEARCWAKLGNFDKAKSEYIESLALASKLSGSKSLQFASVLTKLGDVQFLAGDYRDAVKNYLAAREIWNLNMLVPTFAVASMDERLGYCYEALADKDAALKYFRKALAKPTPWTVAKFESFIEENGFPPQNLPKQAAKVRNMSDGEFYFSISGVPYIQASSRDKNVVRQIADDVHKVTMDSL